MTNGNDMHVSSKSVASHLFTCFPVLVIMSLGGLTFKQWKRYIIPCLINFLAISNKDFYSRTKHLLKQFTQQPNSSILDSELKRIF